MSNERAGKRGARALAKAPGILVKCSWAAQVFVETGPARK
jgi:hypothetical protein